MTFPLPPTSASALPVFGRHFHRRAVGERATGSGLGYGHILWPLFFLTIILAWAGLFFLAQAQSGIPVMGAFAPLFPAAHTPLPALQILGMWALMALAMMLPTLGPMLTTLGDLTSSQVRPWLIPLMFVGGYATVWAGFAVLATGLQIALMAAGLVDVGGLSLAPALTLLLLVLAGLYQFSALKAACVKSCQAPMLYFMSHWRQGPEGGWAMGLRHGAICVGCCWALMALAFVGGAMNLAWMGLATGLMALEKLPSIGRHVTPLIGAILLGLALAYAVYLFTLI